jgi:hypothetical protein
VKPAWPAVEAIFISMSKNAVQSGEGGTSDIAMSVAVRANPVGQ